MSTVPRASRPLPTASALFIGPGSQFDAGINSSTAWTEHLERGSLSDEDPDDHEDVQQHATRPARALYDFEGKPEFRELNVTAGDAIDVIKEELTDGWSLVKKMSGEVGLLPRTYYTFTCDLTLGPDIEVDSQASAARHSRDQSVTPRGSPSSSPAPIIPQDTGEWLKFPSFRRSLLGGKSLNRFSNFVTSGAEEWVLKGTAADVVITSQSLHLKEESEADGGGGGEGNKLGTGEANRHFVDVGPSWKPKLPSFSVLVHSPCKMSTLSGAYTVYQVTSLFSLPSLIENPDTKLATGEGVAAGSNTTISVQRRFSHFVILHTALTRRLPGIALPPLPEKQYAGRFNDDFIEARRGDLERYINRVIRHPIARYAEVLTFFLGCDNNMEWKRLMPIHLSLPPAGPSFFARVFHPAFNVDVEEAEQVAERFQSHIYTVGRSVQALRNLFGHTRQARIEMSKAERLLSYSLFSMITGITLASAQMNGISEDDQTTGGGTGSVNSDGAWCWREGCSDCLSLSKAMQKTAEALQSTADLYDDHARRTALATHEALKAVAHPSSLYDPIIDTHKSTLSRYNHATRQGRADEEMAARCETVLNTTMAEMDTYHSQKLEDFRSLMTDHLDGEIALYEQILQRLRTARSAFDEPQFSELAHTPRAPSLYERDLESAAGPRLTERPLPQPCPHVFDSAPMRPVSVAIQEGVGMLFGSGTGTSRASTFKFW